MNVQIEQIFQFKIGELSEIPTFLPCMHIAGPNVKDFIPPMTHFCIKFHYLEYEEGKRWQSDNI